MALNPITHADGTGYETMIPETIEVEGNLAMPEITFTDEEGNQLNLMIFSRQVKELVKLLIEVI